MRTKMIMKSAEFIAGEHITVTLLDGIPHEMVVNSYNKSTGNVIMTNVMPRASLCKLRSVLGITSGYLYHNIRKAMKLQRKRSDIY